MHVVDGVLGTHAVLWEFAGRTSETAGTWLKEEVYVGARDNRFQVDYLSICLSVIYVSVILSVCLSIYCLSQLEFRARAEELSPSSQIAVKDVYFVYCSPMFIPSGGEWI